MTEMLPPLRIGIAGLGTVGGSVVNLLRQNSNILIQRSGRKLEIAAVAGRDHAKARSCQIEPALWVRDAHELVHRPDVDVVVELIGGASGVALELAQACAVKRRPFVTANKALLATHGFALAEIFEQGATPLYAEAAVAGGIPVMKALGEGLAANRIDAVHGILNGTCNFILSYMRETGLGFASALASAQERGYAEADPAFDIDGRDAAQKLSLLAAMAFGMPPQPQAVHTEGIRRIASLDIAYAEELGYRIKLLGVAIRTEQGITQWVSPCMVPFASALGGVDGVINAVTIKGDWVGAVTLTGAGAGGMATASAVVADLVDCACGRSRPLFGVASRRLVPQALAALSAHRASYYVRLAVADRPGVIADIAAVLRDHAISMASFIQRGRAPEETVPVVFTTHETDEAAITAALASIAKLKTVFETPTLIRIESLT